MNEKLNIQDLIDLLAQKHGMSKKNADSFVKEFFQLIEESLEKDKYVKIKGLGTFKLIDVESRESVNVNTGERFEIQGHTKVAFTPEPTLKDIINKPFSHFETVVLNDNTVLENTPLDNDNNEDEEDTDSKIPEDKVQAVKVTEELSITTGSQNAISTPKAEDSFEEAENVTKEAVEAELVITEEVTPEEIPMKPSGYIETPETITTSEEVSEMPEEVIEREESSAMKYFIGIIVFVVVLCGGAVTFMYYPDLFDRFTSKPPVEEVVEAENDKTANQTSLTDSLVFSKNVQSVKTDTVAESLAATSKPKEFPKEIKSEQQTPKKEQKKTTAKTLQPDSVGYTIVGTETTYTIQEGETLTRVALRFYGTKTLWPYIVKYNPDVIKNPDNVPYGTKIKIPKLVKKQ